MTKRRRPSIAGLDPGTADWANQAARNRAARSSKQLKDAARIRIKIECSALLKETLAELAKDIGTSTSQLAAYLLTGALITYLDTDPDLPLTPSRSPRIACNIDKTEILKALAISRRASSVLSPAGSGAIDGAIDGATGDPA